MAIGWTLRSSRVPRYTPYLGYVFESAGVGGFDDELLAKSLDTFFGDGCHARIFKRFEKLSVVVGWHFDWFKRMESLRGDGADVVGVSYDL